MNRTCTKCRGTYRLSSEFFYKDKKAKEGFSRRCKSCSSKYFKGYLKEKKEEIYQNNKQRYEDNKDIYLSQQKEYYENHRDERLSYAKKYAKENHEKTKIYKRKYNKTAHGRNTKLIAKHRRRSSESKLDSTLTQEQWERCLETFNYSCAYCGASDEVMCREHFIPVIKGGEFSKDNIIPCCGSCNSSKRDRDFFEWYPTKDFYSKQRENKILKYLNYKYHTQQLSIL